jgi:hypothetical protein
MPFLPLPRLLRGLGVLALLPCLVGCSDDVPAADATLVIDGWLDADGFPMVVVTTSLPLAGREDKDLSLSDVLVRWATVSVSDGEHSYVLTGSSDKRYTPPYIYRSYAFRGKPGVDYTVTVSDHGRVATAHSVMPPVTPIDTVVVRALPESDTLRQVELTFTPPEGRHYYHVECRVRGKHYRCLPARLGAVVTNGALPTTIPVYSPKNIADTTRSTSPHFALGDTVDIRLCAVTEEVWQFWSAYDEAVSVGTSIFITPSGSLPTTVSGGKGVWSVQGTATASVVIR